MLKWVVDSDVNDFGYISHSQGDEYKNECIVGCYAV
jgi:hypothetical protein